MTAEFTPAPTQSSHADEHVASRRGFVAAAVTMAAVANAGSRAEAQATSNSRFFNPDGMSKPAQYSHVVEVTGPNRTIYIAGQTGADAGGKVSSDFRAQATQVYENLRMALASVGAGFEHVVKTNNYLTNIPTQIPILREIRDKYLNKGGLPASTTVQVSGLASPEYMIEVEVIAVLPLKT
jgi:enamine deaminase RidA (YjgF/YER057c/UK114 family)